MQQILYGRKRRCGNKSSFIPTSYSTADTFLCNFTGLNAYFYMEEIAFMCVQQTKKKRSALPENEKETFIRR